MQIIAGALKGRRLVTPRGGRTRPTADQIRIALMDALTPALHGARVLDVFAGAGGVGLEALSRGAAHATFIERAAAAVRALERNVAALGLADRTRVLREDAAHALARLSREGARFEIVFLDPPYAASLVEPMIADVGGVVAPRGVVVAQHFTKRAPATRIGVLRAYRTRRFGQTTLTFFRAEGYDAPS